MKPQILWTQTFWTSKCHLGHTLVAAASSESAGLVDGGDVHASDACAVLQPQSVQDSQQQVLLAAVKGQQAELLALAAFCQLQADKLRSTSLLSTPSHISLVRQTS